ncbi:DUF5050 domain-containing protein, partial [Candidatus Gracilibacteria bacterium]|nr:DUF5050 domain-containing protein [Candidatus Gracilibacteria bacterium]
MNSLYRLCFCVLFLVFPLTTFAESHELLNYEVYGEYESGVLYYSPLDIHEQYRSGSIASLSVESRSHHILTRAPLSSFVTKPFTLAGEFIYFIANGSGVGSSPSLYRIQTDGSETQELQSALYSQLIGSTDTKLYYQDFVYSAGRTLVSVHNTTTLENQVVSEHPAELLGFYDGILVWREFSPDGEILAVLHPGNSEVIRSDVGINGFDVRLHTGYLSGVHHEDGKIYVSRSDTPSIISEFSATHPDEVIYVDDQYVLYRDTSGDMFRVAHDGSDYRELGDARSLQKYRVSEDHPGKVFFIDHHFTLRVLDIQTLELESIEASYEFEDFVAIDQTQVYLRGFGSTYVVSLRSELPLPTQLTQSIESPLLEREDVAVGEQIGRFQSG